MSGIDPDALGEPPLERGFPGLAALVDDVAQLKRIVLGGEWPELVGRVETLEVRVERMMLGDPEDYPMAVPPLEHGIPPTEREIADRDRRIEALQTTVAGAHRRIEEFEGERADAEYWRAAYNAQLERANAAEAEVRRLQARRTEIRYYGDDG